MLRRLIAGLLGVLHALATDQTGAIKVKPLADVVKKFIEVTPQRSSYYEAAAKVAGTDWEKNTTDAKAAFKAGVSAANIDTLFAGGVKKAGAEKYNRQVAGKGKDRYGPGVQASAPDYETGVAPMLTEISNITLDARQPRGSEANYNRVRQIGATLHKKRLALRAVGA